MRSNVLNLQELATTTNVFDSAPATLLEGLRNGTAKQNESILFARKQMVLAGTPELIDNDQSRADGVTDFEKGKLQGNQAFLVTRMFIKYAFDASDTVVYTKRYSQFIYAIDSFVLQATTIDTDAGATGNQTVAVNAATIPVQLENANLVLSVNNAVKYRNKVGAFFIRGTQTQKVADHDDNSVSLGLAPILILPESPIQAQFRFNTGVTTPTGVHFVELGLGGVYVYV
ncbi:MAG: hypothetical protein V4538_01755 [Bacteroidota bacterium]